MSIRKLDENVVNRIAAGEIIIHPANALKELLENAIDAGATVVDVLVKDGGLKLLQITDNGSGIQKEDMELLCERFATSKLSKFDDLNLIATYGFRGEALASISHISRLSVVSKTKESPLAYKAFYLNGKLATAKFRADEDGKNSAPKPIAGKDGTQFTVEDLFYNVASRLRSMNAKSEEWARILDVVGRYAVHTSGVGFSCKKFGESFPAISIRPQAPLKERIRTVFGTLVASDLIEFEFKGTDFGLVKVHGAVSGFNYINKRSMNPVFFINNRLVACDPLKRAVASIFQVFLPKGNYPFVYVSMEIVPQNLDVNVHPTKREVRFLHEDEIIEDVTQHLHDVLSSRAASRSFKQSTLKRNPEVPLDAVSVPKKTRQENKLVRVDVLQPKISAYVRHDFNAIVRSSAARDETDLNNSDLQLSKLKKPSRNSQSGHQEDTFVEGDIEDSIMDTVVEDSVADPDIEFSSVARNPHNIVLDSLNELKEELQSTLNRPLTNIFNNLVYVGIVDPEKRLCCFQYDVKLFLCDYAAVLNEFYYQVALSEFANYGEVVFDEPLLLEEILAPLYEKRHDLEDKNTIIDRICGMADMFKEYFQLEVKDRKVYMLPLLMKDVAPSFTKLPFFFYRLGAKVNYTEEKECLHDIMCQLALLYIPERIVPIETEEGKQLAARDAEILNHKLENSIFPALRLRFIAPDTLQAQISQVADLPGLYRVFERC